MESGNYKLLCFMIVGQTFDYLLSDVWLHLISHNFWFRYNLLTVLPNREIRTTYQVVEISITHW